MIAVAQRRICVSGSGVTGSPKIGHFRFQGLRLPVTRAPKDSTLKCPAFGLCHFSVPSERVSKWAIRAALRTRTACHRAVYMWVPLTPADFRVGWLTALTENLRHVQRGF